MRYRPAFLISVAIIGVSYGVIAPLLPDTTWRMIALAVGVLVIVVATRLSEPSARHSSAEEDRATRRRA